MIRTHGMPVACLLALASSIVVAQPPARRPVSLPRPPVPVEATEAALPEYRFDPRKSPAENAAVGRILDRKVAEWEARLTSITQEGTPALAPLATVERVRPDVPFMTARYVVQRNLSAWTLVRNRHREESLCGPDSTQDVELYDGKLGPSQDFVRERYPAVGQVQWNADLAAKFNKPGDVPGNVSDVRWCTGTLIAKDLFLTAGHCFDPKSGGWITPGRMVDGAVKKLEPRELAPLMHVNFNYQLDGKLRTVRDSVVYPVTQLLEYREGPDKLDFGIVRLGPGIDGKLPGERFSIGKIDASDPTPTPIAMLTIIQHPDGKPKRIAAGKKIRYDRGEVLYGDVDTEGGSSGSGLLAQGGAIVGVHTNGGCEADDSGENFGVSAFAISRVSKIIK